MWQDRGRVLDTYEESSHCAVSYLLSASILSPLLLKNSHSVSQF